MSPWAPRRRVPAALEQGARRPWLLLLPAVLGPVGETALITVVGPRDSAALGPQLTAPPPFDLFHDLRWISVYHDSWRLLALELVAAVVFRGLYIAWILQLAWPTERPPAMLPTAARAAAFYAVAAVALIPSVALQFGAALTHLSYLFFVGLPSALLIALVLNRGAQAQAAGRWFHWRPTAATLAWIAGSFLWLTVAGAVVSVAPLGVGLLAAAAAGFMNALAMVHVAAAVGQAHGRPPLRHQWLVPAALVTVFAVVIGGAALGFLGLATRGHADNRSLEIPAHADGRPVLVASGFNSNWQSRTSFPSPPGMVVWPYSYRGLDGRRILPYRAATTLQPLTVSAQRMARQVEALHRAYRRPVAIVAESEGALVARTYLTSFYHPGSGPVDMVVLVGMPVGESSVSYPPPGAQGWGLGAGWALRALGETIRVIGPLRLSADAPFLRDIAECQGLMRAIVDSPPPAGVRQVAIAALADAVAHKSSPSLPRTRRFVVASAHGGLITDPDVQHLIVQALTGKPITQAPGLRPLATTITALSSPWQAPSLTRGLADHRTC